jgi:hypothetical protein
LPAKEPVNLPSSLTGLQQLELEYSSIHDPAALSCLTGLEVLKLSHRYMVGEAGLAAGQLGCLTRLRHLDLNMSYWGHAAAFASPGGLPHLTFLDLSGSMADPAAVPRDWKQWVQPSDPDEYYSRESLSAKRDSLRKPQPGKQSSKGSVQRSTCRSREEALSRRAAAAVEGLLQLGPLPRLQHLNLTMN